MTGGPLAYLGMWDSTRNSQRLFEAVCASLERRRATVDRGTHGASVHGHRTLPPNPDPACVHVLPAHTGGLIQYVFSLSEVDGDDSYDWDSLNRELEIVIVDVAPTIATFSVIYSPVELPLLDLDGANAVLGDGWVNLETCTPRHRAAFAALPDTRLAYRLGPGIRWRNRNAPDTRERTDATIRAVYEAWTGQVGPEEKESQSWPEVSEEKMAPRQLWFCSATTPASALIHRVERAVRPRELAPEILDLGQPGPWPIVRARFTPTGRSVEALIDDLRHTVSEIAPSWAGVQPRSAFIMPGPIEDPERAILGIVTHPWVSLDWIGDALSEMDETLAGCHREETGGGIFWITDPDLAPDSRFTDDWYDSETRFERLCSAAIILGRVARQSIGAIS